MEIKYLYLCLIIIDGFRLICSSMSPYKPPSRSILIVTFEIFLKSSQLPSFFFRFPSPSQFLFAGVFFISSLFPQFLTLSPSFWKSGHPLFIEGGGTGSSEDKPFPFNFSFCKSPATLVHAVLRVATAPRGGQKRGRGFCHSAAGRKSVRPQRQSSANVSWKVWQDKGIRWLFSCLEFTDRVEAHNTVEVKFGIKPEKKKNKMNKKNLSFQFQLLHFPIKQALNLGLRWKTTSE